MHYNDPDIDARDFLYCVMHDSSLPLADRLQASSALLGVEPSPRFTSPTVLYQIPDLPSPEELQAVREWMAFQAEQMAYFRTLPRAEQDELINAVKRIERCNALGVSDLRLMQIKGHGQQ
jgi:hypothetical protein